ncbi:hypothetical protein [Streptomyces sp. NPDC057340]|uniref:hypothetical protein n=1 Tax=Streptomyces sp. NPDC057340 TaxID=3346103 RepID=UPI003643B5AA
MVQIERDGGAAGVRSICHLSARTSFLAFGGELVEKLEQDLDRVLLVLGRQVGDVVAALWERDMQDLSGPGVVAAVAAAGDKPLVPACEPGPPWRTACWS